MHQHGDRDEDRQRDAELTALRQSRHVTQSADDRQEDHHREHPEHARAAQALGSEGAEGRMGDAQRWLEGAADATDDALAQPIAALERAFNELGDAQSGVLKALEALTFNPAELEAVEERLFAIRALARKHGVLADELGDLADDLRGRLATLDAGAGHLATLEADLQDAQKQYDQAANRLTKARSGAAGKLDAQMADELGPLKMERAVFATNVGQGSPGPEGCDDVAFTVATNPGAPAGPLNKIASGGELSRFLLALKVCLTRSAPQLTMIFDEIDRGVGGATADAVGRRLATLAQGGQVLVVTHSPQVAAQGAHHWRVAKRVSGGQTLSSVQPVADAARVDEIARMLAGDTITEAARAAANALLTGKDG